MVNSESIPADPSAFKGLPDEIFTPDTYKVWRPEASVRPLILGIDNNRVEIHDVYSVHKAPPVATAYLAGFQQWPATG